MSQTATVISNNELMPGLCLLWLTCPQISHTVQPGQFVMLNCGMYSEMALRRPLSIHRVDGDNMALLFNIKGKGTQWLSRRCPGEIVDIIGPLGNGFLLDPFSRNLLMIAGGMGIAPLHFLIEKGVSQGKRVTLLIGACSAEYLPVEYIKKEMTSRINTLMVTEDGSFGYQGLVTEYIESAQIDIIDQVFACGPLSMYYGIAVNKKRLGLEGKKIQISLETRMGCGLGICYSCTVRTLHGLKQVCKDGPVFYLDDILWDELTLDYSEKGAGV